MASYTDKPAMQYKDVFQGISGLLGDYNIDADPQCYLYNIYDDEYCYHSKIY